MGDDTVGVTFAFNIDRLLVLVLVDNGNTVASWHAQTFRPLTSSTWMLLFDTELQFMNQHLLHPLQLRA
jgi:hypothetical protein